MSDVMSRSELLWLRKIALKPCDLPSAPGLNSAWKRACLNRRPGAGPPVRSVLDWRHGYAAPV